MKIDIKKVKELSSVELYSTCSSIIKPLYKEYEYAQINQDTFKTIIIACIDSIKENSFEINANDVDTYLQKKFKKSLNQYIKKMMEDSEYALKLLSNYISKNIKNKKTSKEALKELQKVIRFTMSLNYELMPDICIWLLENNSILNKLLKQIIDSNLEIIQQNKIENITKNTDIGLFIRIYCAQNEITIEEELPKENLNVNDICGEAIEITPENQEMRNTVRLYLDEISQYSLLSSEEEVELSIRISNGDELAKKQLAEANLKLVVFIAKKYIGRGLPFLDLVQEGNIGLIKACEKYDANFGFRFSTYAGWWIKGEIERGIKNQARTIRVPSYMVDNITKTDKVEELLISKLKRNPNDEEIAQQMGTTIQKVKEIKQAEKNITSLDTPINENEDSYLSDFIPSSSPIPEEKADSNLLRTHIDKLYKLARLTDREQKILDLSSRSFDGQFYSQEEIGKQFNVTRQRIGQIQDKALQKIRIHPYSNTLIEYAQDPEGAKINLQVYRDFYGQEKRVTKEQFDTRKKEILESRNITRSIYDYESLQQHSKKNIEFVVSSLIDEELDLVTQYENGCWKDDTSSYKFYWVVIPKIEAQLEQLAIKQNVESKYYEPTKKSSTYVHVSINNQTITSEPIKINSRGKAVVAYVQKEKAESTKLSTPKINLISDKRLELEKMQETLKIVKNVEENDQNIMEDISIHLM